MSDTSENTVTQLSYFIFFYFNYGNIVNVVYILDFRNINSIKESKHLKKNPFLHSLRAKVDFVVYHRESAQQH